MAACFLEKRAAKRCSTAHLPIVRSAVEHQRNEVTLRRDKPSLVFVGHREVFMFMGKSASVLKFQQDACRRASVPP